MTGYKTAVLSLAAVLLSIILATHTSSTRLQSVLAIVRKMSSTTQQTTPKAQTSSALLSRTVAKKVLAIETPEGAGALVRRSIGTPALKNISPFLMLDHFTVAEGAGFPDHPHRGQTTVTYMLDGFFNHEDFAGHAGKIGPGDL